MEWSDETVLKLVRLYRSHPVLWDRKQREYKNRNARHDALLQIAVSLGKQKDEIERKIKNLLCHFSREIKKERDSRKVDSLSHYNSKWFCYQSLLFLGARKKSKLGGIQRSDKTDVTTHPADKVLKPTFKEESKGDEQCQFPPPTKTAPDEATFTIREIRETNPDRDEYTLFGEQIAIKLRRLPTSHAKIMVQHIINTTLFEAEMGKYNGPTGTAYTVEYPTYVHDLHPRHRSSTCTNSTSPSSGYAIVHSPYPTKHYPDPEDITGDKE